MSEYRLVLPKQAQGGFSQSPDQSVSNAGSPALDEPLTIKNAAGIGVAVMYGKKVANAGYQAVVGQIGSSRLDEAITIGTKIGGYAVLFAATGGTVVAAAAVAEAATIGITYAVENHATNLDNERLRQTRGTRVNYNAGGYYG